MPGPVSILGHRKKGAWHDEGGCSLAANSKCPRSRSFNTSHGLSSLGTAWPLSVSEIAERML
eukprot:2544931-Rhodomonas_salina.3